MLFSRIKRCARAAFGIFCCGVLLSQPPQSQTQQKSQQSPGQGRSQNPWTGKKHLLVIADAHTGYHHDSTSHAMATIERIGRESGAYMTMIQTDSQLITKGQIWGTRNYGPKGDTRPNAKNLNFFDAIFFYGSGDSELTEQQKADLLSFVHDDGKGFIGAHAANVAFQKWPDYLAMLGGYDNEDFPTVDMPVVIEDPKFPGMSAFPHSFTFKDEFPDLSRSKFADKVHVIVRLDATRLTPQQLAGRSADREFPIAWAKKYGKGRVFFSSFGHRDETWDDPRVQKMYLEAIKWALGQGEADLTPQPLPGSTK